MFQVNHEKSTLFPSKDKSKKLKCRLLQFLFGALRVNNLGPFSHCLVLQSCSVELNIKEYSKVGTSAISIIFSR